MARYGFPEDRSQANREDYDLDDSYAMALSYLSAFIEEDDERALLIEELMGQAELKQGLFQLNLALLSRLLKAEANSRGRDPFQQMPDGLTYLEELRREHANGGSKKS